MDILEDKKLESIEEYQKSRLSDGEYFWRVSYIYENDFKSEYSPVKSFIVLTTPPWLDVSSPQERKKIGDQFIKLKGRTDKGCTVRVNDERVYVNENEEFFSVVYLSAGKNIITVQSKDSYRNVGRLETEVEAVAAEKKGFWHGTGIAVVTLGVIMIILVSVL